MTITIIIPTLNRSASLKRVLMSLNSLQKADNSPIDVLVIDNSSSDDTQQMATEFSKTAWFQLRVLNIPAPNKTEALNLGLKEARGKIIVMTDDDVVFHSDWLQRVVENFKDPSLFVLSGRIIGRCDGAKPEWFSEGLSTVLGDLDARPERGSIQWAPGAHTLFRREVIDRTGYLETNVKVVNEDTIFSEKIRAAGFEIIYDPTLVIEHCFQTEKFTKKYFRRWYFQNGRTIAHINELEDQQSKRRIFNIPLWRWKQFLGYGLGWLKSIFDTKQRFYYELQMLRAYGFVKYRLSH